MRLPNLRLRRAPAPGSEIPLPPRKLIQAVGGDFFETGKEFLGHFIELGGLQRNERVLEVGSGCGRMAVPLTTYLDESGRYEGFDVDKKAVRWCQREITPRFPHFRFRHADVYSKHYNPRALTRGREHTFPYAAASFDFVFLTSVFTHMLRDDVERYLDEIARVLEPNGRCLLTYFLLEEESRRLMAAGRSTVTFDHEVEDTAVWQREVPEAAVAYPTEQVLDALSRRGLDLDGPIHRGDWCGRREALSHQDILIVRRSEK
jgi:SAM-dependent methyltransferase